MGVWVKLHEKSRGVATEIFVNLDEVIKVYSEPRSETQVTTIRGQFIVIETPAEIMSAPNARRDTIPISGTSKPDMAT